MKLNEKSHKFVASTGMNNTHHFFFTWNVKPAIMQFFFGSLLYLLVLVLVELTGMDFRFCVRARTPLDLSPITSDQLSHLESLFSRLAPPFPTLCKEKTKVFPQTNGKRESRGRLDSSSLPTPVNGTDSDLFSWCYGLRITNFNCVIVISNVRCFFLLLE